MTEAIEQEQVLCPNCGAIFDAALDRCPHCLYINPEGAEEKFMGDLEQTRANLDLVDDEARHAFADEMKKGGASTVKRIVIVAVVLVLLLGLVYLVEERPFQKEDDYVSELIWQEEHFPELDDLYAKGRYDEICELIYEYSDEGHDVWDWEHYDELMEYDDARWEALE